MTGVVAATALFCWATIGISLIPCATSVYVLGEYDDKFGGPADNFGQCVLLYGFGLGVASAPFFAAAAWFAVRSHDELLERPWLFAIVAAILASSYALITLLADVYRALIPT